MNSTPDASASGSNGTGARNQRRGGLKESLKREGRTKVEGGKQAAAEQMEDLADAIDVAGSHLDRSRPTLARYATRMADGVAGVAKRLREGSVEDLTHDARQFASRNPGMFLLGGAALGIVLARFLKASAERADSEEPQTVGASNRDETPDEMQRTASASPGSASTAFREPASAGADEPQDIVAPDVTYSAPQRGG
jgi:hypothetical protein